MIDYQREQITPDLISEILPLAQVHFKEVDPFSDKPLALHVEQYLQAEAILRVYSAREGERLVGYAVFTVTKHPHYEDMLQATQDLLFLSPQARHGDEGPNFMRWCDEELANEGVDVIFQYASDRRDIGPILERLGYKQIQRLYARRLD